VNKSLGVGHVYLQTDQPTRDRWLLLLWLLLLFLVLMTPPRPLADEITEAQGSELSHVSQPGDSPPPPSSYPVCHCAGSPLVFHPNQALAESMLYPHVPSGTGHQDPLGLTTTLQVASVRVMRTTQARPVASGWPSPRVPP
jgi:hypothetical protein